MAAELTMGIMNTDGKIEQIEAINAGLLAALEQVYSLIVSAHAHASTEHETAWRTMHKAEDVARAAIAKAKA